MKNKQFFIPVLVGLIAGQIFAEGDRPFTIVNTVRVGYSDNIDHRSDGEGSAFVRDMLDLSFRAALSDRTDLIFKSRFDYRSDKEEDNKFYPNLYAVLTHSVSSRLTLELADKFRSGEKTSGSADGRYDYWENTVSLTPNYILTPKDRVLLPVSYTTRVHDDKIESLDVDVTQAGITWLRELSPQRTQVGVNLRARQVNYPNQYSSYTDPNDGTVYDFDDDESGYDALEMTAELRHTFNPEWQGNVEAGVTYVMPDKPGWNETPTNLPSVTTHKMADNDNSLEPFVRVGLAYEPSPRTRFTVDLEQSYQESNDDKYAGVNSSEIRFGAQHEFTGKITGKATARFLDSDYEASDARTTGVGDDTQERVDLDLRLQYKLNRINFLELGYQYREKSYDSSDRDWEENMVDVGWRVEL